MNCPDFINIERAQVQCLRDYLQDGVSLPSYRGDIINGPEFTEAARVPNPDRLVRAYNQSAATMNLLRAFSTGGYAGLDRVTKWNLDFMENTPEGEKYQDVARRVDESIQFMKVGCGDGSYLVCVCEVYGRPPHSHPNP